MFGLVRKRFNLSSITEFSWEVRTVEFTRLAGEVSLCARGKVLTSPFRGAPLRVFFVPREEVVSTYGYIRCSKVGAAVDLPSTIVLSGRPEFLSELEPLFEFHPEETLIIEFRVSGEQRKNGDPIFRIIDVTVRSSIRSADIGLAIEDLH